MSPDSVFERIELALATTAQGRAFLREFGRKARSEETALLLDAVARLEGRARSEVENVDHDQVRAIIGQIEAALREARLAFRGSSEPHLDRNRLDERQDLAAFAGETSGAILQAVEIIQDATWKMRESGIDSRLCDRLEAQTVAINAACARHRRTLDGLSTVERSISCVDAFVSELRHAVGPPPSTAAVPLNADVPMTLVDSDVEFGPPHKAEAPTTPE